METKTILLSRTFWAALLALAGAVMHLFGIQFPSSEQASIADQIMGIIPYALELIGFVGVLWGRITAREQVTITGKDVPVPPVVVAKAMAAGGAGQLSPDRARGD